LVFCCDCTSSMGAYIKQAKETIKTVSEAVLEMDKSILLGLVAFRDHPPQENTYSTKTFPLTESIEEMQQNIGSLTAQGGGDGPEAVTCALNEALNMNYREGSVRIVVVISDAPPHGLGEFLDGFPQGCDCGFDPLEVARKMVLKNIIIYSVGVEPALGTYKNGRAFYRAISDITNGRYLSLGKAHLLKDVIVGGSIEELDLASIKEIVESETRSLRSSSRSLSISDIEEGVFNKLRNTGLNTMKLDVTHQINDDEIPDSVIIAKSRNLLEAMEILSKQPRKEEKPLEMSTYDPSKYSTQNVSYSRSPVSKEQVSKIIRRSGGMDL